MPIRPLPYPLECSKCRWRKTVAPASDALEPGEWHSSCPRCNGQVRKKILSGPIQRLVAQWWLSVRRR